MKALTRRPYQENCLVKIVRRFKEGINRLLVVWPTGLGKTVLFAGLPETLEFGIRLASSNRHRMLVLVHRDELITQAVDAIREWNPSLSVGIERGDEVAKDYHQVVVASVPTLGREDSTRLFRYRAEEFGAIVVDECFPAGTLVDGVPIETLRPGDIVSAYSEAEQRLVSRRVVRLFRNSAKALVRVTAGSRSVVCTPSHPFLTTNGWVPARELSLYSHVVIRDTTDMHTVRDCDRDSDQVPEVQVQERRSGVLFEGVREELQHSTSFRTNGRDQQKVRVGQDDIEKSDAQPANQESCVGHPQAGMSQTFSEGRERIHYGTAKTSSPGSWVGHGNSCTYKSESAGVSTQLQARRCESTTDGRDRSGWEVTLVIGAQDPGCKEAGFLRVARVDSVEVLEPGSDGTFGGVCRDGNVYNIEVESDHTYVADGFVVHNCHHAVADTYQTILDYFRVYDDKEILLLGVTATPNRADGKGLGKIFQEIVDHITILWAIKHGWLVDMSHGKLIVPGSSLDGVKRLSSDNEVANAIDNEANNDFVAKAWLQEAAGLRTIMFCAKVDHAQNMASALQRIGVGAEAIWADDPARAEKIAKHKSGEIQVLCNVNILIEGYDDRDIECVALNRPTDSASLYTQMIGRGARLPNQLKDLGYDNLLEAIEAGHKIRKTKCLVLDFVYATRKHKLVFLPNLLGLAPGFDMDGKSLAEVGEMIEKVKERKPKFNLATAAGFGSLEILVHNVDLLKVDYSPEVKELSQNQWIAHDDSYVLMMPRKDRLVIVPAKDRTWTVSGMVNGKDILKYKLQTLREAFKYADTQIRILGGLTAVSGVRREGASWHNEPANANQIRLAELAGIKVPPGTTRGDLSKKINEAMVKSRDAVRKLKDEMEGKRW